MGSCLVAVILLTGSTALIASLLPPLQPGCLAPLPLLGLRQFGVLVRKSVPSQPLKGNNTTQNWLSDWAVERFRVE